jgi:hypothetical protein
LLRSVVQFQTDATQIPKKKALEHEDWMKDNHIVGGVYAKDRIAK